MKRLRLPVAAKIVAGIITAVLVGCAANRLHSDAMGFIAQGDHDAAIATLREALRLEPNNSEYRIQLLNEQAAWSAELVRRGDAARVGGRMEDAAASYRHALQVQPANERAQRGLDAIEADVHTAALVADSQRLARDGSFDAARDKVKAALLISPRDPAAVRQMSAVQEQMDKQREARAMQVAAQSVMRRPVTLQFRDANLRMVFEALSRTTGLNVILDRDVRADLKTTIFVKDASVEDTVDLILLQNQLDKRLLNANTMFVYPATSAKQKEYQDLQVRTFQVLNADVKNLQTVLKTVLKVKEISIDERTGTVVIRDTPDAIAVASKIIAAHDTPEPEVMLEVAVLEISHDRLNNLGIEYPSSFTVSTPPEATTLRALRNLHSGDLLGTPLGMKFNFLLTDTDANLLASPRIRARNKEKARVLIGDRVPIITNTVTPVATGAGVVTGSVQYQDVGLKLEFEPQVYSEDEVGIKISLEVSSIVKEISGPNGSLAYQIGTRNAQTVVRLRDGENQILGGLISSEDRTTAAKVPGLGQLPVLGRLFSNNNGNTIKTEIILSITPRILRAPANIDSSLREVYSGTEASIRQRQLQLDPVGSARMQSAVVGPIPAPSLPPPVAVPTVAPVLPAPAAPAAPSPSTSRPMVPTVAPATAPPSATPATAPSTTGPTPAPAAAAYMRNLLPYMNGSRYPRPAAPAAAQPTGEAASAPAAESAASATRSTS